MNYIDSDVSVQFALQRLVEAVADPESGAEGGDHPLNMLKIL